MKRRKFIKSLAFLGIGTTVSNYQSYLSVFDASQPMKVACLGHTPCDMIEYFIEKGLRPEDTYSLHYEKLRNHGCSTIDLISGLDIFLAFGNKYLLIISPAEGEMAKLAEDIIYYLNQFSLEYHIIIIGSFPFEGRSKIDRTEKFKSNCYGAASIIFINMHDIIAQYGQLGWESAHIAFYNELLKYIHELS